MPHSRTRSICTAVPRWRASCETKPASIPGADSSAAMNSRPSRSVCPSWQPSSTPAAGGRISPGGWNTTRSWPACGSSVRTCRARPIASPSTPRSRTSMAIRCRTCTSTTTRTTSRCAIMPILRRAHLPGGGCDPHFPHAAVPFDPQPGHLPHGGLGGRQRVQCIRPDTRHSEPLHLRRQPFTTGGAENPTLTIVALAIRQADHIASQMSRKAI